jgi:hypothetical protein
VTYLFLGRQAEPASPQPSSPPPGYDELNLGDPIDQFAAGASASPPPQEGEINKVLIIHIETYLLYL